MTCREKLKIEHPIFVNDKYTGGCRGCPGEYGYLPGFVYGESCEIGEINEINCARCWDQEIYDTDDLSNDIDELYSRLRFSGFTEEQAQIILEGFHVIVKYLKTKEGRDASV